MDSLDKEICLINEIIENAVDHGRDAGGAYFLNGIDLKFSIEKWLKFRGIEDKYEVYCDSNELDDYIFIKEKND